MTTDWDEPEPTNTTDVAWYCRWHGGETLVWARTIQDARLQARQLAGPTVAVSARLATRLEQGIQP